MTVFSDSFPGRTIVKDGIEYLYFGGTAYLGLQTDRNFQDIFIKNIRAFGTNYGASRKSNVQLSIFDQAEKYLANTVGSEACVTLSSGYLAGQFIAKTLNTGEHQFFYAPNTHSALHHSEVKISRTFAELNTDLRKQLVTKEGKVPVVFLDTIDFLGTNYPDFEGLRSLPLHEIILVADDSHGLGIVGEHGSGAFEQLKGLNPKELIVCGSLGKGFGVQAGAIFGSQRRITALTETNFFGGASPVTPAGLATLMDSSKLHAEKRAILQDNIHWFLQNISNLERFDYNDAHPAFSFSNEFLVDYLIKNKIILTNFRYPNETSGLKSRIVLSASHKKEDIQYLIKHLNTL